jgi:triacylglycerol lipase
MPNFDHTATKFSAKNALLLAEMCNAAYGTEAEARAITQQNGFTDFEWIDLPQQLEDTSAFVTSCDKFAVIAFCGTKDLKNWMTNLHSTPGRFAWFFEGAPEVGDVHAGFAFALRHSWKEITAAMNRVAPPVATAVSDLQGLSTTPQRTLWITGHSLGGALAALAGAAFSMLPGNIIRPVGGVYTFGQPRIGLHNFCGYYDRLLQLKTFRFINKEDLVPRVPFRGWDYSDLGQMIHFDSNGLPHRESRQWTNFLARTFESFEDFFTIATHFSPEVGDHSRTGYEQLVRDRQAQLDALFA